MKTDTEAKVARAGGLFQEGYNCAQAVFAAFAEEMALGEAQALRIASGFGGGVGGLGQICGAFTGAIMALGALSGYDDPQAPDEKKRMYGAVRSMHAELVDLYGTSACAALKLAAAEAAAPAGEQLVEAAACAGKRTTEAAQKQPAGACASHRSGDAKAVRPCIRYVEACVRLLAAELEKR